MYDIFTGDGNRIDTVRTFTEAVERLCKEVEYFAIYYITQGPRIVPVAVAMRTDNIIRVMVDDEAIVYKIRRNEDKTISYEVTRTIVKQPGPIGSYSKVLQ